MFVGKDIMFSDSYLSLRITYEMVKRYKKIIS